LFTTKAQRHKEIMRSSIHRFLSRSFGSFSGAFWAVVVFLMGGGAFCYFVARPLFNGFVFACFLGYVFLVLYEIVLRFFPSLLLTKIWRVFLEFAILVVILAVGLITALSIYGLFISVSNTEKGLGLLFGGDAYAESLDLMPNHPILIIMMVLAPIHFWLLMRLPRLSTHAARRIGVIFALPYLVFYIVYFCLGNLGANDGGEAFMLFLSPFVPLWMCGFVYYSVPSNWVSAIPLFMHYLIIAALVVFEDDAIPMLMVVYIPLAGFFLPRHRRVAEWLRPKPLPRIAPTRGATR
jgi:hypothetical protein